jgi:hypothetical protein
MGSRTIQIKEVILMIDYTQYGDPGRAALDWVSQHEKLLNNSSSGLVVQVQQNASQLSNIVTQTSVSAVSNTYNLNINNSSVRKFKIETLDTITKTIVLTNAPTNCEVTIKLKFTNNATFNPTANVTWKDTVTPVFTVGKTYLLYLVTDDGGGTWQGVWTGAW